MSAPRLPEERGPARIAPLPSLPVFYRLAGRKAVIAGGGAGALWKAELLAAAGARLLVLAGHPAAARLFADVPATVLPRGWTEADLAGAAIAIGDLPGAEGARFAAAARAAGAAVNLIDHAGDSDFTIGTIVNRAPIVIGISTDGAAPMLGQAIRTRIESVLPRGLSRWTEAARHWRAGLKTALPDFAARRAFWTRFTRRAWAEADRAPTAADRAALLAGAEGAARGRVTLVGAGPGDPELLTLKAARALREASVILHDDLVGPDILDLARREARRIAVGKRGHAPSCRQADIVRLMIDLARAGEQVVRLKGGDPLIFGRAAEEIDGCRAAGIAVEIVPGISAAQGAAAALGRALTERRVARRLQFVTGHDSDGGLPRDIDWRAIADPEATTALYMPRRTLAAFVAAACAAGLDPETPAAAIAAATRRDQAHVAGPLGTLAARAAALDPAAPVIVLIGGAMRGLAAEAGLAARAA
jgi:uroporphyrin-III C-methyltransferase/precorrin-2 dehydrogenase/sirohydrochlorin ferrochelatase